MKFRRKPVIVEAEQWFPNKEVEGVYFSSKQNHFMKTKEGSFEMVGLIDTLEGTMIVRSGDWVITGVKGEKYPCKDEIFKELYERAEDCD